MNIYTEVPSSQIAAEKQYLLSAVFKLLPYKQDNYEYLDKYFNSLFQKLIGFNKISGYQPELITIISLLRYAKEEEDFEQYRKAILDACGLIVKIRESDPNA